MNADIWKDPLWKEIKRTEVVDSFRSFHAANPKVYELFKRFAYEARDAGAKHYGARAIVERIRWHVSIDTGCIDGFKLKNDYAACYARLLIIENPFFERLFKRVVQSKADVEDRQINLF